MTAGIEIVPLAREADVERVRAAWPDDGLAGFAHPAFVAAGARAALALGRRALLVIATAHDGGRGAFALRLERRLGVTLGHALCDPVAQYTELAGSWPQDLPADALRTALVEAGIDALVLPKLRDDGPLARLLPPVALRTHEMLAPVLPIASFADADAFHAAFGATTRKSRRQRQARFSRLGEVAFACERGVTAETGAALGEIVAMKRDWLDARGLVSRVLHEPVWTAALVEALLGLKDDLVLSRLTLDGQLVAGEIGILAGGTYRSYLGAYDDTQAAHGVGAIQMTSTIGWCIAQRVEAVDLMAPDDPYKRSWTLDAPPATLSDRLWGLTARGRAFVGIGGRLEPGLRRAYSRLPPAVKLRIQSLVARR